MSPVLYPVLAVCKLLFITLFCVGLHELGHYLACLTCNVTPPSFSVGVGPAVYSCVDRRGTTWRIGALPLGGYVEMPTGLPRVAQIWVSLAGPLANFVTGFGLLVGVVLYDGCTIVSRDERVYVRVAGALEAPCHSLLQEERALFGAQSLVKCGPAAATLVAWCVLRESGERMYRSLTDVYYDPASVLDKFKGPIGLGQIVVGVGSVLGLLCLAVQLAFSLGLFNLLPLFPLDGGVILCACLGIDMEKDGWVINVLAMLALILLLFVIVISSADLWRLCIAGQAWLAASRS